MPMHCPIGPAPRIATFSPACRRVRSTARTAIETGSVIAATAGSAVSIPNT